MASARVPPLLIVLMGLLGSSLPVRAAAAIEPCSAADREALLVGALAVEVQASAAEKVRGQRTACVVVGLGDSERAVDPPDRVMLRLKRIVRTKVVARSRAADCMSKVETWVGEPLCLGNSARVRSKHYDHCWLDFTRVQSQWDPHLAQVCE